MDDLEAAVAATGRGDLVVYPTETVYGLGADALDPAAIARVYAAKRRHREDPLSFGVADVETARSYTAPTDRERRFMDAFLPGPVTVLVDRGPAIPNVLTADRDRVGIRIPDHDLARSLLDRAGPLTATSANVSGRGSVRRISNLDTEIHEAVAVVIDDGETPGTESTVVDVAEGEVLRRGALAEEIDSWLAENP